MPRRVSAPLLLLALVIAPGCGGGGGDEAPATTSLPAKVPALASRPAAKGEIVVRGEASPASHGPFAFDGRYLVRFVQYAPEDSTLDFASQTPFSAALARREGDPRGATELFEDASADGRRELEIRGRRYVDVRFGDFPYVIRFTPRDG